MQDEQFDIAVIGGGLVGASLVLAGAPWGYDRYHEGAN